MQIKNIKSINEVERTKNIFKLKKNVMVNEKLKWIPDFIRQISKGKILLVEELSVLMKRTLTVPHITTTQLPEIDKIIHSITSNSALEFVYTSVKTY